MAKNKKKIAGVIPVSTTHSRPTKSGDNWRSTPTFERGWAQKEIDFHVANIPKADRRTVYGDEKVKTEKAPKLKAEK
jgi:hypothetical protein